MHAVEKLHACVVSCNDAQCACFVRVVVNARTSGACNAALHASGTVCTDIIVIELITRNHSLPEDEFEV